ncbi:MAG: cytochrome c-type biogenesis protein CcmH [Rickettsiales bacterium]|jgi:cytochrome c-type biogenesis protein CcmH/NrfF|nr:cytochrome c-type biogenesis protein CcmH [Rickettsiales bacterium]
MKKLILILLLNLVILGSYSFVAMAIAPESRLVNQAQEERAMKLFLKIRCLTCQGQVIENSDSDFARQIRYFVRKEIELGSSDEEITAKLIQNFGTDIVADGNIKNNLFLWLIPLVFSIVLLIFLNKKQIILFSKKNNPI